MRCNTHTGHAGARKKLAEPIDQRLFFAGEATSLEFYATCHGAYLTGIATAHDVAVTLGADEARRKAV